MKVYSYIRFSTAEQAAGSSSDRQEAYAQRYAAENGITLDASLTLRDEGLSAYHQRHIRQGALGAFLLAIEQGKVEPGSVLIVEGLDRLSRAEPLTAQALLTQIIDAGVTVVTASDGKHYSRQSLRANPMDLVYSILVMIRAHEESDTKSKRVKAAIVRTCEQWQAGTYRGLIRNGKDPAWVRWDGQQWQLIPERVEAVRLIIDLYLDGHGPSHIKRTLRERGLTPATQTDNAPNSDRIYKLIKTRTLIGEKRVTVDGQRFDLQGYYPPILTQAEFDQLQYGASKRVKMVGQRQIVGLVTGFGAAFCGYCGAAMAAQNVMHRVKPDGSLCDGLRRVICSGHSGRQDCPVGSSCSVAPIERALLAYCSDAMEIGAVLGREDAAKPLQAEVAKLGRLIGEANSKISKLTDALLELDEPPLAIAKKIRDLEADVSAMTAKQDQALAELRATTSGDHKALADRWAEFAGQVTELDPDARAKARSLIAQTFTRIDVYVKGVWAGAGNTLAKLAAVDAGSRKKADTIDLVLTFKGGGRRFLSIDKKGGRWRAQRDFTIPGMLDRLE